MRTFTLRLSLLLCIGLTGIPVLSQAQSANAAPPTMQRLDEGDAPAVTIRPSDTGKKITEKREQGVVTEVQVQSGRNSYKLKQSAGAGNAAAGDAQSNTVRAAQFTIKEFDLGRKPVVEPPQDATLQPAYPPPDSAPAQK